MKKCPYCAESIQEEAIKCRFCGEFLAKPPSAAEPWYFKTASLAVCFLIVGPFVLPLVWLNPRYDGKTKILWTAVIVIASILLGVVLVQATQTLIAYYQKLFALLHEV